MFNHPNNFLLIGMALKTSNSPMRSAYLLLLFSALHTNTLTSALPLISALTKVLHSTVKQSAEVLDTFLVWHLPPLNQINAIYFIVYILVLAEFWLISEILFNRYKLL